MRKLVLAAAAVLSVSVGLAYAADRQSHVTTMASGTADGRAAGTGVFTYHYGPNPWDGTQSWKQWNEDHPSVAGGN